jgi:putative colanic acid biosynthesis acetyltransferase WcaF
MEVKTDLAGYQNAGFREKLPNILVRASWLVTNIVVFRNALVTSYGIKRTLLRMFGARVGKGVVVKPSVSIKYPWNLSIGDHSWVGEHVWIDNLGKVEIGSNVCISQGAMLLTGNHDFSDRYFSLIVENIHIEDGCWIGARSMVCPGVRCKDHSVLSVMSVATRDLERYTIYKGNPATPVKERVIH